MVQEKFKSGIGLYSIWLYSATSQRSFLSSYFDATKSLPWIKSSNLSLKK